MGRWPGRLGRKQLQQRAVVVIITVVAAAAVAVGVAAILTAQSRRAVGKEMGTEAVTFVMPARTLLR